MKKYFADDKQTLEIRFTSLGTLANILSATAHKLSYDNTSDKHILEIQEIINDMIVMLCVSADEFESLYKELPDETIAYLDDIESHRNDSLCESTNAALATAAFTYTTRCFEHQKQRAVALYDKLIDNLILRYIDKLE